MSGYYKPCKEFDICNEISVHRKDSCIDLNTGIFLTLLLFFP